MLAIWILLCIWLVYSAISAIRVQQTKVPGPWYSSLTSFVLKYYEFTRRRRLWVHSLHLQYGAVVRLAPNEVSFANLEGLKQIYQSGASGYDKTEFYDLFKQYGYRTMFSTLNKHDHSRRKKLFAEKYAMTNIIRSQVVNGFEQRAASVIRNCTASIGSYLDVYVVLHCYALDCASHFLFSPGGSDTLNNPEDFKVMQELSYHDSLQRRLIDYYLPTLSRIGMLFSPKSTPLSQQFVLDRAQNLYSPPDECSLLHKLQSKGSELQTIQMAAECMDHMAAGIDTTGDGLCFLMYELSLPRSQHVQRRLQQEIIENSTAKVDELPYLDAVVKEGLRLFPPIPMSLPRYVPEHGREICGYQLPAHSIVSCQAYSLHLLNHKVFPNAASFVPERWLEEEGTLDRNRLFFAFASGGRGCIGKNLALVEMKTLLREIYKKFSTKVAPEMRGDMSIDDQIIASRPKDQTCLLVFEELKQEY